MRFSRLVSKTLRSDPPDAETASHRLMLRAGLIQQVAAGVYTYLPLALRSLRKIENIIREEMDAVGGQELLMPALQPQELWEQTGRNVRVNKVVGVYTRPNITGRYADGNRIQPISFSFEAEIIGGELGLSDETTAYGYFPIDDLDAVDLWAHHRQRIEDAVQNRPAAFFR